jgi:phospholipase C
LQAASAIGVGGGLTAPERAFASSPAVGRRVVARAAATTPHGSDLGAVEHVIYLMMENRSYDHYFGSYRAGRGFDDHPKRSLGAFAQAYPGGSNLKPKDVLLPFHLDTDAGDYCTGDLTHEWGAMHQCWNGGSMDSFVKVHTSSANEGPNGAMTMGYFTRHDLPFYYAVADAFTLCDGYHCSILGPTHPNRLMAQSGSIDPTGTKGGPITDTNSNPNYRWSLRWPTVQEVLEDSGITWKVYNPSNLDLPPKYAELAALPTWNPALYDPSNPISQDITDNILWYFKNYESVLSPLHQKAFNPTFPGDFARDVMAGTLPSVSWLMPPQGYDEHPSSSPVGGMYFTSLVLEALAANPAVWSKTVLFLMHDENDGWFDHVTPPSAPPGTEGEYLTAKSISSETLGIRGPLGLGVRVPMLVISPFSRGGHIASQVFDHTSQMFFLAERFGIEVPNVSAYRRSVVGNLTSTLFKSPPAYAMPSLPKVPFEVPPESGSCSAYNQYSQSGGASPMVPQHQTMPTQEPNPSRRR